VSKSDQGKTYYSLIRYAIKYQITHLYVNNLKRGDMLYEYYCAHCNSDWEISKKLVEIDRPEFCDDCHETLARKISDKISFSGHKVDDNQTYFNHALGCEVRSESHAKRIAKERGFVELGNDKPPPDNPRQKEYSLSDADYHDTIGIGAIRGGGN